MAGTWAGGRLSPMVDLWEIGMGESLKFKAKILTFIAGNRSL